MINGNYFNAEGNGMEGGWNEFIWLYTATSDVRF
jgi:hypothetical protein